MGANGLKVQITDSMQRQRALHNPSQGTRVLFSETISYLKKKKKKKKIIKFSLRCASMTSHIR